jgi:chorismate synthase
MQNTFGKIFRLTTFGESHGVAMGGVVDGCPAGLVIDVERIQNELDRRKPGQSELTSARTENDTIEILSGVFNGMSTGTPIAFVIRNHDQRSFDYDNLLNVYRPSHADFTYDTKYGIRDHRGGGRASARETVARVAGGAIAKMLLQHYGITLMAYVDQIGMIKAVVQPETVTAEAIENTATRCPVADDAEKMINLIQSLKPLGETTGGAISCIIKGVPPGLGEPVFDKLQADLAKAVMSINAAKGFEYGEGFGAAQMLGSAHNDSFSADGEGKISMLTNHSGGIQGGISCGSDIVFRVAFKPVATILQKQKSVDTKGNNIEYVASGRHDVCVVPRAVPVVEAMAALVLADHFLRHRNSKL